MENNAQDAGKARLSRTLDHIIDKNDQRVEFDDPRIVHIGAVDGSRYTKHLMAKVYEKRHRKLRTIPATSAETMHLARKLCSGRECVPMTAMAGAVLNDILHFRTDDEISLYFTLDQTGPCQNGAWPAVWESMAKRLDVGNAIFGVWPNAANHRLGLGNDVVRDFITCYILGDFFDEAENALHVLARDKRGALESFEAEFNGFADLFLENKNAVHPALKKWAANMARIPLAAKVVQTPKVLIFGGLNLQFVHYPLTQYFIDQGIIPKVVDAAEGMLWLSSESIMRNSFKAGRVDPKKQFSLPVLLFSWLLNIGDKAEARQSLQDRIGMLFADRLMKRFRKTMEKSDLMVDVHIPYPKLAAAGHRYVTYNGFTETAATVGRYLCSIQKGHYDGLINIGSFNCQPAMNAQAIIRPLANKNDLPYAAIDCEGPWLSANQRRLLETVAVQARRVRTEKG
jgi:predicted nucleotide-binding protein (sugar kinase/HSP70/actin superfamily)